MEASRPDGARVPRDLVCFSHLRWDFVYQRPNHLMARAARDRRVFFVEEPVFLPDGPTRLTSAMRGGVTVLTPQIPLGLASETVTRRLAGLMDELVAGEAIDRPNLWYYTPMSLPWTRHLAANATVYDSMDYLAGFHGAAPELLGLEEELLQRADLVFCGGASLHARMRDRHPNSHCFPSSVDLDHFRQARSTTVVPADQAAIGRPRVGYAGVIDERVDLDLIDSVAAARPDWQVVLVGPVVKIPADLLPSRPNIHQLGMKTYQELPGYLAGWDVGWMPFARNAATRFISPTKTPEYLAAGLPVVSTSIQDVVDPYGRRALVTIADSVADTVRAMGRALAGNVPDRADVDSFLAIRSWDRTWAAMNELVATFEARPAVRAARPARRRTGLAGRHASPSRGGAHLGRDRATSPGPAARTGSRPAQRGVGSEETRG